MRFDHDGASSKVLWDEHVEVEQRRERVVSNLHDREVGLRKDPSAGYLTGGIEG